MDVLNLLIRILLIAMGAVLIIALFVLKFTMFLIRLLFKKRVKRLPTGEKVIEYADGRNMIELKSDHGPTRMVRSTPELLAKLAERKPKGRLARFVVFLRD
ncbi:MAG: hypothetical protein DI585_05660 [Pseudomonas fluorescens]|nr:MAG: hypothetical protein DI585_05660 [Pseudomonas fluorescens]